MANIFVNGYVEVHVTIECDCEDTFDDVIFLNSFPKPGDTLVVFLTCPHCEVEHKVICSCTPEFEPKVSIEVSYE